MVVGVNFANSSSNKVHKRVEKKKVREWERNCFRVLINWLIVYLLGVNAHQVVGIKKNVA
jgi:hypothetical protein